MRPDLFLAPLDEDGPDDGLPSTAGHYVSVYRNLLGFVDAQLVADPRSSRRTELERWRTRFDERLRFWESRKTPTRSRFRAG